MSNRNKIEWKPFVVSLLLTMAAGGISALLSGNSMDVYEKLNLPSLAPPAMVFPIVWTILYLLMGISAFLIYRSEDNLKRRALYIYGIQLLVNIVWPLIFFRIQANLFAFIWIVILCILVILMIVVFYKIDKTAAILQMPYLIWVLFASYLNLSIYLLNR